MTVRKEDRPLGELFSELMSELRMLLKQEMTLVRTEVTEKLVQLAKDAAALGAGGVVLHASFLTLIAALVLGLANFVPLWLAALLMAILLAIIGGALVQKGRKDLTQMKVVPERSSETVKETLKWAKSQVRPTR